MARSSKESFKALYEIAQSQQGFFTTKQAISAGFTDPLHALAPGQGSKIDLRAEGTQIDCACGPQTKGAASLQDATILAHVFLGLKPQAIGTTQLRRVRKPPSSMVSPQQKRCV